MGEVTLEKLEKTIDDLAITVKGGFDQVDKRFKSLEHKMNDGFDRLEHRMDKQEAENRASFASVHSSIDRLQADIDDIKLRLERLKKRTIEDDSAITQEITDLTQRVDYLEKELNRLKLSES